MRRSALAAFSILFLPCLVFAGHIDLNLNLEATIPGLSHGIEQVKFNDIDGDNVPEILACDGYRLVLYSVSGDSTIMSVDIDPDHLNYLILFDNINMDSLPDVVLATYKSWDITQVTGSIPTDTARVTYFSPANDYAATYFKTYSLSPPIFLPIRSGISALQATDLNGDGWNELLVSMDNVQFSSPLLLERNCGLTETFYNFPWGRTHSWTRQTAGFTEITGNATTRYFLDESPCDSYEEAMSFWGYYLKTCTYVINGEGDRIATIPSSNVPFRFGEYYDVTNINRTHPVCQGELRGPNPFTEIICTFEETTEPASTAGQALPINRGQRMFRYRPPDTLELIWENDEYYSNYAYHPQFPYYYFAMSYSSLIQFKGIDGSRHQAIGNLPEGERWWDYPYNDDIPRLIVVAEQTVKIYTLDISTDTPEDNSETPSLPGSFVLSSPYPNPFNAEVAIPIQVLKPGRLSVAVYNTLGQCVRTLHDRPTQSGEIMLSWDATAFASGVYVIDVRMGDQRDSRTIQLVK